MAAPGRVCTVSVTTLPGRTHVGSTEAVSGTDRLNVNRAGMGPVGFDPAPPDPRVDTAPGTLPPRSGATLGGVRWPADRFDRAATCTAAFWAAGSRPCPGTDAHAPPSTATSATAIASRRLAIIGGGT